MFLIFYRPELWLCDSVIAFYFIVPRSGCIGLPRRNEKTEPGAYVFFPVKSYCCYSIPKERIGFFPLFQTPWPSSFPPFWFPSLFLWKNRVPNAPVVVSFFMFLFIGCLSCWWLDVWFKCSRLLFQRVWTVFKRIYEGVRKVWMAVISIALSIFFWSIWYSCCSYELTHNNFS